MAASTDARRLPEWADMQGLVLSSYPHLDQASYVLMAIDDAGAARQWLARMSDRVTSAFKLPESRQPRSPRTRHVCHLNVAFTSSGLQRLGGAIANFSDAFIEGIHGRAHRTTLLGDVGPSAPANWRWGGPESGIDLLVMVFAEEDAPLDEEVDEILPTRGLRVVVRQDARRLSTMAGREHFGFRDGISQPILRGSVDAERFPESIHLTELGEFVLGYPNADGIAVGERDRTGRTIPLPRVGECIDWGRNGTYLVLRQLEQHVDAFWNDMTERTADGGRADRDAANRLAAKFVGRTLDGTPMVPYGGVDDNEFVYGEDPHGDGCPLGAHVRRANPRDSFDNANLPFAPANNHRILRRGRSYVRASTVAAAADERGLLFLCLNADIERQFEFIQQNWINNPSFLGLTGERDPLIGSGPALVAGRAGVFTIAGIPAPICVGGLPRFVTVRGGGYFFLPGLAALKCLTCHA